MNDNREYICPICGGTYILRSKRTENGRTYYAQPGHPFRIPITCVCKPKRK